MMRFLKAKSRNLIGMVAERGIAGVRCDGRATSATSMRRVRDQFAAVSHGGRIATYQPTDKLLLEFCRKIA